MASFLEKSKEFWRKFTLFRKEEVLGTVVDEGNVRGNNGGNVSVVCNLLFKREKKSKG